MTTNFKHEQYILITSSDNIAVAVVKCPTGEQDITGKICTAICENEVADLVTIDFKGEIPEFLTKQVDFEATIYQDDQEPGTYTYSVELITIY